MGAGASAITVPDDLKEADKEQCKKIAGELYDEKMFTALAGDKGVVSRDDFNKAVPKKEEDSDGPDMAALLQRPPASGGAATEKEEDSDGPDMAVLLQRPPASGGTAPSSSLEDELKALLEGCATATEGAKDAKTQAVRIRRHSREITESLAQSVESATKFMALSKLGSIHVSLATELNGRDVLTPADVKAILDKKLVDASAQSNLTVSVDDVARLIRGEKGLPDDAEAQIVATTDEDAFAAIVSNTIVFDKIDADGNGNIDYNELTEALKQSMGDSVEPLEVRKLICVANGKLTDEVTDEAVLAFDESVLCVDLFAFGSVMKQAAKVQKQEAYPVEASK